MNRDTLLHSIFLTILFSLIVVKAVSAQEQTPPPPSDDEVNSIAKQMYCPVCENIPLDVCDTQACEQWRDLIREKLAAGWSEDQIIDYFVLQYGDRVLGEPPLRGLNWLVYILPAAFFLGGVFVLVRVFWRINPKPKDVMEGTVANMHADPYENRVEEALRERRK